MPNPHTAGPGDGCMVHAGVLTPHGGDKSKAQLTSGFPEAAKERFIEDVIKELTGGSPPFPCGDALTPIDPEMAERLRRDLPNEEIFPDFHKNILGYYKDLAVSLDNESEYNMLPVADPVALATSLGGNLQLEGLGDFIGFMIPNPPMLAIKLGIELPDLPGALAKLPIPKLPPGINIPLPEMPQLGIGLPSIEIPSLLSMKLSMVLNFPDFMIGLIGNIPGIAFKLMTLDITGALGEVCKLINDSQLFGPAQPTDKDGKHPDSVLLASKRVLARKMAEMSICHALSKTLGTAPSGITGLTMKEMGYSPPLGKKEDSKDPETKARDTMAAACANMADTYFSSDPEKYAYFILPKETSDNLQVGIRSCEQASSCGMFARTVLARGGAIFYMDPKIPALKVPTYYEGEFSRYSTNGKFGNVTINRDWFNDEYKGNAPADIIHIASVRGALIPPTDGYAGRWADNKTNRMSHLPSLKRGDIIIVYSTETAGREHVIVVSEDYEAGSSTLYTVEGGAADETNVGTASYIKHPEVKKRAGEADFIFQARKMAVSLSRTVNPTPAKGIRCTGIKAKSYNYVSSFPYSVKPADPVKYMGPNARGLFAIGDGRVVGYLIDSWKLISGNPNQNAKQPGTDPISSKEQGYVPIDPEGKLAPLGDTNDDTLEDQNTPLPALEIVPINEDGTFVK